MGALDVRGISCGKDAPAETFSFVRAAYPGNEQHHWQREDESIDLRRNDDDPKNAFMAILADRPPDRDGPGPAHRGGQNVLFVGGNVRFGHPGRPTRFEQVERP